MIATVLIGNLFEMNSQPEQRDNNVAPLIDLVIKQEQGADTVGGVEVLGVAVKMETMSSDYLLGLIAARDNLNEMIEKGIYIKLRLVLFWSGR